MVVVVENAKGELLTSNKLMDLLIEEDISIKEIVDHYEHYNESEEQSYEIFRSIKLD